MTDPHAASKSVHAIEAQNIVMRQVIDSAFARGALNTREKNQLVGIIHEDSSLSGHSMAKDLVKLYGERVKSPCDPESGERDTSRTQAVHNVEKLLRKGPSYDRLAVAVVAAGSYFDRVNRSWLGRPHCGNFFGQKAVYREFLPEAVDPVPDAGKAEKVNGLFEQGAE